MRTFRRICVYCGSSTGRDVYVEAARDLGRFLADRGIGVVYGGGRVGLAGIREAWLDAHPRLVPGDIRDAHGLDAHGEEVLGVRPLQRHDAGGGGVELEGEGEGVSEDDFVKMRTARDAQLAMPVLILPSVQVNMRAGVLPPAEDNGVRYMKLPIDAL